MSDREDQNAFIDLRVDDPEGKSSEHAPPNVAIHGRPCGWIKKDQLDGVFDFVHKRRPESNLGVVIVGNGGEILGPCLRMEVKPPHLRRRRASASTARPGMGLTRPDFISRNRLLASAIHLRSFPDLAP